MPEPTSLWEVLSEAGSPVGAGVLAWGLVKGADALESDAKKERLEDISALLKDKSLGSVGRLGASVVPFLFHKIFGLNPFSRKFVGRSILASLIFWSVLLLVKRTPIRDIISALSPGDPIWGRWLFLAMFLLTDWLSLAKAKLILTIMSRKIILPWSIIFLMLDIICTLGLLLIIAGLYNVILTAIFSVTHGYGFTFSQAWFAFVGQDRDLIRLVMDSSSSYNARDDVSQVATLSTLLTSAWVHFSFYQCYL